eukprot:15348556-Ditylum_brightwellii.AAC.1
MCEVEKEQRSNRLKEKFSDFLKIIGHRMKDFQMMEILNVSVSWDMAMMTPRDQIKVVDIF